MMADRRGGYSVSTNRDPHTEPKEAKRRGGGDYDGGPGKTGMPSAAELDRPPSPCGTYGRTGTRRGDIGYGISKIQD